MPYDDIPEHDDRDVGMIESPLPFFYFAQTGDEIATATGEEFLTASQGLIQDDGK